jgi:hypothetical protein
VTPCSPAAASWSYAKLGPSISDVLLEAPVTPLHRVFATPGDVADVAEALVRHWRTSAGGVRSGVGPGARGTQGV